MNRPPPHSEPPQEQSRAEPPARDGAAAAGADRYRGVALGVECAWPAALERGAMHPG